MFARLRACEGSGSRSRSGSKIFPAMKKALFLTSFLPLLALCSLTSVASAADDEGFTSIFDGKSLDGWVGDPKLWSVEDGAITGKTSDEEPIEYNSFIRWANGEIDDFELKLQYRIYNGNSGIQIRSFEAAKPYSVGGYQADFEAGEQWSGTNYGEQFRGVLAKRGEKTEIGEDGKPTVTGSLAKPKSCRKSSARKIGTITTSSHAAITSCSRSTVR